MNVPATPLLGSDMRRVTKLASGSAPTEDKVRKMPEDMRKKSTRFSATLCFISSLMNFSKMNRYCGRDLSRCAAVISSILLLFSTKASSPSKAGNPMRTTGFSGKVSCAVESAGKIAAAAESRRIAARSETGKDTERTVMTRSIDSARTFGRPPRHGTVRRGEPRTRPRQKPSLSIAKPARRAHPRLFGLVPRSLKIPAREPLGRQRRKLRTTSPNARDRGTAPLRRISPKRPCVRDCGESPSTRR